MKIWLFVSLFLTGVASAFEPAFGPDDVNYAACRQIRDGIASPAEPAQVKRVLGFHPVDDNCEKVKWEAGEAAPEKTTVFEYLVVLNRPVEVGAVCVDPADESYKGSKNNGELFYLKAGPADPAKPEQWSKIEFAPVQPMTRFATLPVGVKSQAFLYRDVRVAGVSHVDHWRFFRQRLLNVVALAKGSTSGGFQSKDPATLTRGEAWDSQVLPAWCELAWEKPQTVAGVFVRSNAKAFKIQARTETGWRDVEPVASLVDRHDFSQYAFSWRWLSLPPTTTVALRIKIPAVEMGGNTIWVYGLGAFVDWQSAPVPATVVHDDQPPFRIPYNVPADGFVAVALDDAQGHRVKDVVAQVERPAGTASEAWDLKDSTGAYVAPGTYRLKGITGPPTKLVYQVTPYPNVDQLWPDRTPWLQGHSGAHGWLADHTQYWAVAAVGDRVYFGSPMAEAGVCLIECDRDGKKQWGKHDFDAWKGVGQLAGDNKYLYVASSDDVLYRLDPATSNAVTKLGPIFNNPERRGNFSCMAAYDGRVYLGFTGENFTDNAVQASAVDLEHCLPKTVGDPYLRAFRMFGPPPGQDVNPNDPKPKGNGRLDIESTLGTGRDQYSVIAFRAPVPLGSVVFPHPGGKEQLQFSVLKPGAAYPPQSANEQDWLPFESSGTPGAWNCIAAPAGTLTRAIRIKFSRPELPAADATLDELETIVTGKADTTGQWYGRLEGLRLLRRRFKSPTARVRVNSGTVAADGSWDAQRTEALGPENPGIYVMEWNTPQKLRGLAIKEVDGAVTEVDVWQGPADGKIPLAGEALDSRSTATGWRHVTTYRQKRRSAYTPAWNMNIYARYLDDCVDFNGEVVTRAVRLRVAEQWLDHGEKGAECRKHDGRSEHGVHYTQSFNAKLDTRLCRIEGVAPLQYLGGEPTVDEKAYRRVAVIDGQTGALLKEFSAEVGWHGLACGPDGKLYAINREHNGIIRIDTETGVMTPVVSNIEPGTMTVGPDQLIYVSPWTDHGRREIQVYDLAGKRVRTIGKPGGRPVGSWDAERFGPVHRMCVDRNGSLWVVETDDYPKRIVQYDTRNGRLLKEIFGNTRYGGGGGGNLDRYDASRLWYGRVEFGIDWTNRTSHVRGLLTKALDGEDVVAVRVKGRDETYLATAPLTINSRQSCGVVYQYDEATGTVRKVAAVGNADFFEPLRASAIVSKLSGAVPQDFIFIWSDLNGNGEVDADEVQFSAKPKGFTGVGRFDYALGCTGHGVLFEVKEFLSNGVPVYRQVPIAGNPHLRLTNGNFLSLYSPSVENGPNENFVCTTTGEKLWSHPAGGGVSGLYIPPWTPGQVNNQFGIIGHEVAPVGDLGEFVVIHANTGEWNIWTADGLLAGQVLLHKANPASKLFGPPEVKPGTRLDPLSANQEHFHGFFTRTEADNRYFIVAGFTHMSVIEVCGLDKYRRFGAEVRVTADDIQRAQAWEKMHLRQQIVARALVVDAVPRPGLPQAVNVDQSDALTLKIGYDETQLYLTWTGKGLGPIKNSGTEFQRLFKTGAALDFQLGTDPAANPKRERPARGDLRLLITFVDGKPKVVLYQPVAPGSAANESWSTQTAAGGETKFDRVTLLSSVDVKVRGDRDFVVEATIPLRALGLQIQPGMKLKMDWGILTSSDGNQVKQRLYWANKLATGTSDEAIEARLEPALWGTVQFDSDDLDDLRK